MKLRLACWLTMVGIGLMACSSSSAPSGNGSGTGSGQPVTQTIGTSGGTVSAQGITLTVPAGALPSDTPITITPSTDPIPSPYTGLSQLYTFGPDGTVFQTPATVAFTLSNMGTTPTVYWSNASGGFDPLTTTAISGGVSAPVMHFSRGFVADYANIQPTDAGTTVDAGPVSGIVATVGGTVTTFATNQKVTVSTNTTTISADDSSATNHWTIQILMNGTASETCMLNGGPSILYAHMIGPQTDKSYTSKGSGGVCSITLSNNPVSTVDHATGSFTATLAKSMGQSTDPATMDFAGGDFDLTL